MPDGPVAPFDRDAFVAENAQEFINPRRIASPPTRAEREASVRASLDLDEREKALAEAFDLPLSETEKAKHAAPKTARGEAVGFRRRR